MMLEQSKSCCMVVRVEGITLADPEGLLGVRTPFWGTPNFIKRGKRCVRAHTVKTAF